MSFVSALAAIGAGITAGASGLGLSAGAAAAAGTIGSGIVGGAALGAGLGGVGSALSGGDFLEGMGTGALGGAITGGIGSGLGAAGSAIGSAGAGPSSMFSSMSSPISAPATQATALANSSPVMASSGVNSMFNSMGASPASSLMASTAAPLSSPIASATAPAMSSIASATPMADKFLQSPLVENAVMPSIGKEGLIGTLGELGTSYNEMSPLKRAAFLGQVGMGVSSMLGPLSGSSSVMSQPEEESSIVYDPMAITKARRRYAEGGIASLGSYSDGGQLLKGPGDGVSDDIPASIEGGQPARLADGEFVVPARIVSELGNGSTDAGARRLYEMVDRVQSGRKQTTKKGTHAKDTKAYKHLPA